MRVLVTGGAGFIGAPLCERLIARGDSVVAADLLTLGRREHVAHLPDDRFRLQVADVADAAALDAVFADGPFDAVVHLAANSDIGVSFTDPGIDRHHTFATTWSVLDAMRRHGVGQLVFASTSAIYGEAAGAIREDHGPLRPISHYGAAKLASEAFISAFAASYGIRAWVARFPNVVGPRATHGALFDWVAKLRRTPDRLEVLGDGRQTKPYLHVDDLLDAILLGWDRLDAPLNAFNVGGETRCSVRRMAEITVEEWGRPIDVYYTGGDRGWVGDVPSVEYDTGLIRSLGWTPKRDSETAVREAVRALIAAP
jgi:UDP-glucose 4-epimerase